MSDFLTIQSESAYELSRKHVQADTALLDEIDLHHKGAIEQYEAYKQIRKPVEERIAAHRNQQRLWLTAQREQVTRQAKQITDSFQTERVKLLHEQAESLRNAGNVEQATMIEQLATSQSSINVEIAAPPGTQTRWSYEIVNEDLLVPPYVTIVRKVQRKEILKAVTQHGKGAESIVGAGSIEVQTIVVPVYRKEK